MELVTKSSRLNSLWSIVYCSVTLAAHIFITYLGVSKYRRMNKDEVWNGEIPSELKTYIALIVLSVLFLPLFVFFSFLKVGNIANDGTKLGRDHAWNSSSNVLGSRIKCLVLRCIWEQFPPISSLCHLLSAFLVLIPEVILTAVQVNRGIMSSDMVWSSNLDFLFDSERAVTSNIISQSNITIKMNMSFYVVPTPKPPVGGWTRDSALHVSFVYMAAELVLFAVRYSAVFWFTNKIFSAIFATQLLFMMIQSLFSFCGIDILYKLSSNIEKYDGNINVNLKPGVILCLYILSGIVLLFSTFCVFSYGASYFQDKFKIIDKRHHPEAYTKQTVMVNGSCHDYKYHTSAMISLVLLGLLKGPILYGLVTLYRDTNDSMILSCIVIDVCYMIFWIVLWTILTLKQQWQFRILDYVPLSQPVYTITNDNTAKRASYHGGSIDLQQQCQKKRPRSLPSDLASSESGFGDVNSSEDERERFESSLPPLAEVPTNLENSRRKGSTHSLDRRSRGRRNGNQRVTFDDTVKRCTSTDSELFLRRPNCKKQLQTTADIHGVIIQPGSSGQVCPMEFKVRQMHEPGCRHSVATTPSGFVTAPLYIGLKKQSASFSDLGSSSGSNNDKNEISFKKDHSLDHGQVCPDLLITNDSTCGARHYLQKINNDIGSKTHTDGKSRFRVCGNHKASSPVKDTNKFTLADIKEDSVLNSNHLSPKSSESNHLSPKSSESNHLSPKSSESNHLSPKSSESNHLSPKSSESNHLSPKSSESNHLSPKSSEFIDKKHNVYLDRRDSASYSLPSLQEIASNGSDHAHQALCSQV